MFRNNFKNTFGKIQALCIFFFLNLIFSSVVSANECFSYYSYGLGRPPFSEDYLYNKIGRFLIPDSMIMNFSEQTLFVQNFLPSRQIEMLKPNDLPWLSMFQTSKEGNSSPQGDARAFAALAGPELALHTGFEFQRTSEGILMRAPNAELLEELVLNVNKQLIAERKDPISFLPVRAGYLNSEQILRLSTSAKGDFVTFFPFEDKQAMLTLHEIAWHLGSMLLPKKIHVKSRQIDQETLSMVETLRKSGLPRANEVAQQLMVERSWELDSGNANLTHSLARARISFGLPSYALLKSHFIKEPNDTLLAAVTFLMRPGFSAKQVVARRVIEMLKVRYLFSEYYEMHQNFIYAQSDTVGLKLDLSALEKNRYFDFLTDYMDSPEYVAERGDSKETAQLVFLSILDSLDQRIIDVNSAFRKIPQFSRGSKK